MLLLLDSANRAFGRLWDRMFVAHKEPVALALFMLLALGVSIAIFAGLQLLPKKMKKRLIIGGTFVAGLFFLLEFALPGHGKNQDNILTPWIPRVGDAVLVIGAFTWGLGLINLTQVHGKAVARMKEGWYNSLAFFVGLFAMFGFGLWNAYAKPDENSHAWGKVAYEVLFLGFLSNLGASVFSLLAFYIVSAAYRAFRIRSHEATVMMLAAFVVMLGQVPLGQALTHNLTGPWAALRFERVSEWLLTGINGAAQRGITFGMAVGALAMSLRIWLSLERGSFFDAEV